MSVQLLTKMHTQADGSVDMISVSMKMKNFSTDCWKPIMKYVMSVSAVTGMTRIGMMSHRTLDKKNAEIIKKTGLSKSHNYHTQNSL